MNRITTLLILAGAIGVGLLLYRLLVPPQEDVESFLGHHWERPIPFQGPPPAAFSDLEASLDPQSCAQCHAEQHADWKQSLHSETFSPGLRWQLQLMTPEQGKSCLQCHAPMSEQVTLVAAERGWPGAPAEAPPAHIPRDLHEQGLACAACHVRKHERVGPPPRDPNIDPEQGPHGGFTAKAAFKDSRFCAACHQFPEDGPRVNGKLRENTVVQWQQSRHAEEGRTCQRCHMPGRRHQWRGIHDPAMTASALETTFQVSDDRVVAAVSNTGAGHHFPTYMVPEIELRLERVAADGKRQALAREIIAWRTNLALTEELFDTRIKSGETRELEADLSPALAQNESLELVMAVAPRRLYERTFEDYQQRQGDKLDPAVRALLTLSIAEAKNSHYQRILARYPARVAN
ncbi:multiheme c-type cytochrome [Thiohalophilus sp.]|uniref:multiheme c-type cytochrome n=1 Tax=Thiohalophilus sp. TaxID=3028392 RepID=UPI002ACE5544|nr:multiheme c-type cytochrome [Thiohalophilus sp.]MDZ7662404.1 multiheme c-type cytochrome [Thiohalophilus sp.]